MGGGETLSKQKEKSVVEVRSSSYLAGKINRQSFTIHFFYWPFIGESVQLGTRGTVEMTFDKAIMESEGKVKEED